MEEAIVIDTPEGIALYRLLATRSALSIEVRTGMKVTRHNVLKLAQQDYGVKSRTKKGALVELDAIIEGLGAK